MASSSWERRNERARAQGYRNYYDYRNAQAKAKGYKGYYDYRLHDYGKRKRPPRSAQGRQAQAGHRGNAALKRALRRPDTIAVIGAAPERRGGDGQFDQMRFIVTHTDARIVEYVVDLDIDDLDWWEEEFDDLDIDYIPYGKAAE